MAVSTSAPRHGVSPARAKRTVLPVTTTMLHASETTGSSRKSNPASASSAL